MGDDDEPRTVLIHPALLPAFEEFLRVRGLEMTNVGRLGGEDGGDYWLVSPTDEAMRRARLLG